MKERNMDIGTKNVKLVKYGKELRFSTQFLPKLSHVISLGGLR